MRFCGDSKSRCFDVYTNFTPVGNIPIQFSSISVRFFSSVTCVYKSIVILIDECPISSCITLGCTPFSKHLVAKVCLKVWGLKSANSSSPSFRFLLIFRTTVLIDSLKLLSVIGEAIRVLNINFSNPLTGLIFLRFFISPFNHSYCLRWHSNTAIASFVNGIARFPCSVLGGFILNVLYFYTISF